MCVCYRDTSRYVDNDNNDAAAVARLAPFFVVCSNRKARPFAISQCKYVE